MKSLIAHWLFQMSIVNMVFCQSLAKVDLGHLDPFEGNFIAEPIESHNQKKLYYSIGEHALSKNTIWVSDKGGNNTWINQRPLRKLSLKFDHTTIVKVFDDGTLLVRHRYLGGPLITGNDGTTDGSRIIYTEYRIMTEEGRVISKIEIDDSEINENLWLIQMSNDKSKMVVYDRSNTLFLLKRESKGYYKISKRIPFGQYELTDMSISRNGVLYFIDERGVVFYSKSVDPTWEEWTVPQFLDNRVNEDSTYVDWVTTNDDVNFFVETSRDERKESFLLTPYFNALVDLPAETKPGVFDPTRENQRINYIGEKNKVALVVGVSAYKSIPPLRNTVNDAHDISKTLHDLGFSVIQLTNPSTKRQVLDIVREFVATLNGRENSIGFFYYSGHGMQIEGMNFLIPANADIKAKEDVDDQCVNFDYILNAMKLPSNKLNIFVLDACRNNPFKSIYRAADSGLSFINPPKGSYILYATKPGSVSSDGTGRNGLFTSKLLKYLPTPNMTIEQIFKRVAREVSIESLDQQRPWVTYDYTDEFYFRGN